MPHISLPPTSDKNLSLDQIHKSLVKILLPLKQGITLTRLISNFRYSNELDADFFLDYNCTNNIEFISKHSRGILSYQKSIFDTGNIGSSHSTQVCKTETLDCSDSDLKGNWFLNDKLRELIKPGDKKRDEDTSETHNNNLKPKSGSSTSVLTEKRSLNDKEGPVTVLYQGWDVFFPAELDNLNSPKTEKQVLTKSQQKVKNSIQALLVSSQVGCSTKQLIADYQMVNNENINYKLFGVESIEKLFLAEFNDIMTRDLRNGKWISKKSDKAEHIQELVNKQKANVKNRIMPESLVDRDNSQYYRKLNNNNCPSTDQPEKKLSKQDLRNILTAKLTSAKPKKINAAPVRSASFDVIKDTRVFNPPVKLKQESNSSNGQRSLKSVDLSKNLNQQFISMIKLEILAQKEHISKLQSNVQNMENLVSSFENKLLERETNLIENVTILQDRLKINGLSYD